jgi:NAD(P)-dependent dehydrogenase (short-subunit alcohol dehydrogenase family)
MSTNAKSDRSVLERFDVKGKTIVITGASRGLGLSFARMLASVGANIAGIDVHEAPSNEFAELSDAAQHRYYAANVTDYERMRATVNKISEDFGHIDGLCVSSWSRCYAFVLIKARIPAAGIIRDKPLLEYTEKDWRDTIDVDVSSSPCNLYTVLISTSAHRSMVCRTTLCSKNGRAEDWWKHRMHFINRCTCELSSTDYRWLHRSKVRCPWHGEASGSGASCTQDTCKLSSPRVGL